jgi:hypothetical protein
MLEKVGVQGDEIYLPQNTDMETRGNFGELRGTLIPPSSPQVPLSSQERLNAYFKSSTLP